MFRTQVICCAIAIAVITTSCEPMSSSDSGSIDKTKDWTEVVTMVVSPEIGTVYGMEGVPSEGMMVKEEGKKRPEMKEVPVRLNFSEVAFTKYLIKV